jgi:hypothetical protein
MGYTSIWFCLFIKNMYKPMNRVEGMGFVSLAAGPGYIYILFFQLSLFSAKKWVQWDMNLAGKWFSNL